MLVVEHFIILTIDPDTGLPARPSRVQTTGQLAAAALLLELSALHRIELSDGRLHADAAQPLSHQLLNEALRELAAQPVSVANSLALIERRLRPLPQKVKDGLFHRDILHRAASRLPWRHVRYPLRSVQARNEAIERLRQATRIHDDLSDMALLMVADINGLLPTYLDARKHDAATRLLLALNDVAAQREPTRMLFAAVRSTLLA